MTKQWTSSATRPITPNKSAGEAASYWMQVMLIVSVITVASVGLLGWVTTRSITQSTRKIIGRVSEMAGGAGDLTARVDIDSTR